MKRLCVVLIVLGAVAGVYAGQTLAFPWMTDTMKAPCDKTALEWAIAEKSIRQDEPVKVTKEYDIVSMTAKPTQRGLVVQMNLKRRPGISLAPGHRDWQFKMNGLPAEAAIIVRKAYATADAFEDMRGLYLAISIDDRLTVCGTLDHVQVLPVNATQSQQRQAIVTLLSE